MQGQSQRGGLTGGPRGFGNTNKNSGGGGGGGSHGGQDPQAISAGQISSAAQQVAAGGTNPYGGFDPDGNRSIIEDRNELFDRTGLTTTQAYNIAQQYNIPNVADDPGGILGFAKKAGYNLFANPAFSALTGNLPGLFAGIVFGKGPYTQKSIVSGNFADLTNAPANYVNAVKAVMGDSWEGSTEQEQALAGQKAREDARKENNRKDPAALSAQDQALIQKEIVDSYKTTLSPYQLKVYEQLAALGYNDDYIRSYLQFV